MKLRRIVGLSGFLVAALIALDWFPPLNDAVYPPPEAPSRARPGLLQSDWPAMTGGASPSPAAPVARTAEPTFAPSVRWLTAPVEATIEPRVDASVSGIASWYRYRPGEAAAGPALRVGDWRGSVVTVCGRACATVKLTDACQCYGTRVIDLDAGTFEAVCGALSKGLCTVTVEW